MTKTSRRLLTTAAVLAGVGLVAAGAPAAYAFGGSRGRIVEADQAPARVVAIILGAEVYPSGTPSRYLRARLDVGARLYRDGKARVLIVSGDDSPEHNRETSAMRAYLVREGVPAGKIVEDVAGLDTYDTCVRAKRVFGVTDALLVSQSYHLPRAVTTCRAAGVDAWGVGDSSVRRGSSFWRIGEVREYAAYVKMAFDLLSQRVPRLEPPSSAVREALAR
ncbi:SanA/YdcF family protein [Nigerium massiliense]|uniref:SanA/YdcF family protein n=1 Tax=Nigerium massiliense TaxID=1522317 RepID=UPI00069358C3|nr:ElyC/SanA/YdcF family protein [Nigerium massiliense]